MTFAAPSPRAWAHGVPRCVFISGGSSGIGRELGILLARCGADVAIFNRSLAPGAVAAIRAHAIRPDQRIRCYAADVSDEAAIASAVERAVADLGSPDLCIHSAGVLAAAPFEELDGATFTRVIGVNLIGARHFASAVLRHMRRGSHLTLIASMAGLVGSFAYAAYGASKFGVVGLAEVLRIEQRLRGIDISVCCPAELPTPMVTEERKTLHPAAAALKDFVGTMPLEAACAEMLAGMARRRFMIVPGLMPRLSAWFARHMPGALRKISDFVVDRAIAR
ncbi:SDR family NAD(P)-dependent oxidoreductase [Aquabacterium sp.]|uniref:SDR family NAD(P)-dependent oxidoreductase n=1 Tax=Aquabacterium sp. TaxID=1872578 RepID=UPI0035B0598C